MDRIIKTRTFSGTKSKEITELERRGQEIARQAAAEGMVLLKNDGILPISKKEPIALLGAGAGRTIKGGTGSGDVCERESVTVYRGMKDAGFAITSEDWIFDYDSRYVKAREAWKEMIIQKAGGTRTPAFFDVYASHAFCFPDGREITEEDFKGASTAVYVISRIAGEGADRKREQGDYALTDKEIRDLQVMAGLGISIVLLLNIGGLIDLTPVEKNPAVRAILYISQPGMEGGRAVADLLSGEVNPSGKLTDSWAHFYSDYPNADQFSYLSKDVTREEYREDIFVGYRYFDTYEIPVLYSFGYGISYTDFRIESLAAPKTAGTDVTLSFRVTNTGDCAGKEVVQVYAAAPSGKLKKEYRRLVGSCKTNLLQSGESEEVQITIEAKQLASYDESSSSWILEKGTYYLLAGNSLENSSLFGALELEETIVPEKLHAICPLREELEIYSGCEDRRRERLLGLEQQMREKSITPTPWASVIETALKGEEKADPFNDPLYDEAIKLAEELTEEELIYMSVGEISRGHDVALGAAGIMVPGAAGETSSILEKSGNVPGVAMADGPAGIRVIQSYLADENEKQVYTQGFLGAIEQGFFADPLEEKEECSMYYQFCTAFPIGILLAQTWNPELQVQVGRQVGLEMENLGISWWLAPGMNIHRNPLCGRNFEYYSEDPVVSGETAASITIGVQSVAGCGTTIKHFCCNNQEDNRVGSDSIIGERALREIYLRGFEIAVKKAQPMSIMSSYNLLNGVHTANCRDILMTVLREEWGFRGFVMTDWTTTGNGSSAFRCVKNGNELIMPGSPSDLEDIREALRSGELTREELQESVARLLRVIFQTNAYVIK